MPFCNRALKAQGTHLLEVCVDFTVQENSDSGGCSSSRQEFSLEQLYINEMSPGLVTAMQRSVLPVQPVQGNYIEAVYWRSRLRDARGADCPPR